jgi:hypothetical protein
MARPSPPYAFAACLALPIGSEDREPRWNDIEA